MSALEQDLLARLKATEDRSIAFLQALLRAPSPNPPGDTRQAAAVILDALHQGGLDPTVIAPRADMPNIISRFDAARSGRHLVLNGHIDTFPAAEGEWDRKPYGGEIADGRIYGRGACDMKGGLASLTLAFLHLNAVRDRLAGSLSFTAVSDEETFGPWGARYLFQHHRELMIGDCLLSGEPSSPECVRFGEKSPYWFVVTVRTKGAHGAYTHASRSATKIAASVMQALEQLKTLPARAPDNLLAMFRDPAIASQVDEGCGTGHSAAIPKITINLGRISGGLKMNMIPSQCRLEVDLRLPIGLTKEEVRPHLVRILSQFPEAEWEEEEKKNQVRVPFETLLKEQLIKAGELLYTRKAYGTTAIVLSDGKLEYKNQIGSIHRIGAIIQQTPSCNGWKFWHVMRNNESVLIDNIRSEYLRRLERL